MGDIVRRYPTAINNEEKCLNELVLCKSLFTVSPFSVEDHFGRRQLGPVSLNHPKNIDGAPINLLIFSEEVFKSWRDLFHRNEDDWNVLQNSLL